MTKLDPLVEKSLDLSQIDAWTIGSNAGVEHLNVWISRGKEADICIFPGGVRSPR
jgi:hypothetical protein